MRRIAAPRAGWSDFAVETVVVQGKIDFKHCPIPLLVFWVSDVSVTVVS